MKEVALQLDALLRLNIAICWVKDAYMEVTAAAGLDQEFSYKFFNFIVFNCQCVSPFEKKY